MKKYKFHLNRGNGTHETIEVPENELTLKQKKMLLDQLLQVWDNTPKEQQNDFIKKLAEETMEKVVHRFGKEMDKRIALDDRIDELIKYWKSNHKKYDDKLNRMVQDIERDYDYVGITIYPEAKLVVKIHDGIQEFN